MTETDRSYEPHSVLAGIYIAFMLERGRLTWLVLPNKKKMRHSRPYRAISYSVPSILE